MRCIEISAMGYTIIHNIDKDSPVVDYETLREIFARMEDPIEWFEVVKVRIADKKYLMLLDDNGKLRRKPYNRIASLIYNNPNDVIVGNVIILADSLTNDGEMYFLNNEDVLNVLLTANYPLNNPLLSPAT